MNSEVHPRRNMSRFPLPPFVGGASGSRPVGGNAANTSTTISQQPLLSHRQPPYTSDSRNLTPAYGYAPLKSCIPRVVVYDYPPESVTEFMSKMKFMLSALQKILSRSKHDPTI